MVCGQLGCGDSAPQEPCPQDPAAHGRGERQQRGERQCGRHLVVPTVRHSIASHIASQPTGGRPIPDRLPRLSGHPGADLLPGDPGLGVEVVGVLPQEVRGARQTGSQVLAQ